MRPNSYKRSGHFHSSPLFLGFLASHNGTDMQAVINALQRKELNGKACVIISNNKDAYALQFGKEHDIPTFHISTKSIGSTEDTDATIKKVLQQHDVNLIILSGYMKKIQRTTLDAFPHRILNIHPSLLPLHAGLWGDAVHTAVIQSGTKETGVTIHTIDADYDKGEVLWQSRVPIFSSDTIQTLKMRVQQEEIQALLVILKKVQRKEIRLLAN